MAKERLEALCKIVGLPSLLKNRRERLNKSFRGEFTQLKAGLKISAILDKKVFSEECSAKEAESAKNLVSSLQRTKPYPLPATKEYLEPKKLQAVCEAYQLPRPLYELRNKHFLVIDVFAYLSRNDSAFTIYLQPAEQGTENYTSPTIIYTLVYLLLNRSESTITICRRTEDKKMGLLLISAILLAEKYRADDKTLTDKDYSEMVIYQAVKEVIDRYENHAHNNPEQAPFPWKSSFLKPYLERINFYFRREGKNKEVYQAANQNPVSYWYYRSQHTTNDNTAFISISETDFFKLSDPDMELLHSRFQILTKKQGYKNLAVNDHRFLPEIKKMIQSDLNYKF